MCPKPGRKAQVSFQPLFIYSAHFLGPSARPPFTFRSTSTPTFKGHRPGGKVIKTLSCQFQTHGLNNAYTGWLEA